MVIPMRRIAVDLLIYLLNLLILSFTNTSPYNFLWAVIGVATYEWLRKAQR